MARKSKRRISKKNKGPKISTEMANMPPADTRRAVDIILEDCGPKNLSGLDWLSINGHYISGEELAVAIEANPGQSLPDGLRDYLCRFLRGKVKRKPGPRRSEDKFHFLIEYLAANEYRKELRRLQKERKFRGREAIGKGELSPHEQAIKLIKERFRIRFGSVTPERVANIISSHN